LRVGFIISGSLENLTGGYIYDRQLVRYLEQKGHTVDLYRFSSQGYIDRLLHSPQLLWKSLGSPSPDILLEDELDHPALVPLNRRLRSQAKFPVISIVHHLRCCEPGPAWQKGLYRRLEKRYLAGVDGFIFNSDTTRRVVEDLTGKRLPSVTAYPCGDRLKEQITVEEIRKRAENTGPLRILFLGALIYRKALHVLLRAVAGLPEGSAFLTVVGDTTADRAYVKAIRKQIQKSNMEKKVAILNRVSDSHLIALLRENQVLAVPSYYEGFGIAYLEGMGFGLPAIATTEGAAREIITHGQDGFLVPAGDSQSLRHYLQVLSQDRHKLLMMSLKAHQRFNRHPTWQAAGESILNFLQTVYHSRQAI
jgi:glycosyltransferase involved in cell wall biosynthesis